MENIKTIIDGNKTLRNSQLIAEFVGWKCTTPTDPDFRIYERLNKKARFGVDIIDLHGFKYHLVWDQLLLVVEKVELLYDTTFIILNRKCTISVHNEESRLTAEHATGSRINNVYNSIVDVIKWHNKHKEKI